LKFIDAYEKIPEKDRPPFMVILDSLGMLSTEKEMADSLEGKSVRDMTRTQAIKGTFRTITLKLARAGVPMFVTNHVYEAVGAYVPTKNLSGGSGLKYAASAIAMISKSKDRNADKDVVGIIVTVKMFKSRLSKENQQVHVRITYDKGLDRYYGLVELAEKAGIFVKTGKQYKVPAQDKPVFENAILKNPQKFFTKDVLKLIDEFCHKEFKYGAGEVEGNDILQMDEQEV